MHYSSPLGQTREICSSNQSYVLLCHTSSTVFLHLLYIKNACAMWSNILITGTQSKAQKCRSMQLLPVT